ncbi:L-lactate permease [Heliobacterium gestii]|uniref:L-lactate permease n=1 Tax=Heliomicrobium gestii TaxID=2699 RepID=A0A845LAB5_HELGE|nr:lactate permease LctP family transporter [Heliomicrobium gestii]MBM7865207.1 lactate permease [Heliomicrobium gestii]MZP41475.1 L-lactate permease [Heliomicrobium gestii]
MWTQVFDPMGNIFLSAAIAVIPIIYLFWALAIQKMKGYIAGVTTTTLAVLIAILVYGMPAQLAIASTLQGALYGLFPICWIVITAVFLYNLTVKSGQFEVIKDSIASITDDRRLQALLIAFSFGAFLEGAAGFGTPVAITAGMLVGLGFNPLYAASLCLIANTAPVAFGGIGIPIIVAGQVSGIDDFTISQMVGRQLPFLSIFVPFWLVYIMSGWKGVKEVWPAALISGGAFAIGQFWSSNYLGAMLPDIISSLCSIISLVVFLKLWKPKNVWRFENEPAATYSASSANLTFKKVLKAWSPFVILTILVGDWGMKAVNAVLETVTLKFHFPIIDGAVINPATSKPIEVLFKFNWLSAAGTAILVAALITMVIVRMPLSQGLSVFWDTIKSLKFPIITIAAVLGYSSIANSSGMTYTMGMALAATGALFPLFSPILGRLGVFITGSDTSANAVFAKLQGVTADKIGVDPVLTVAANSSGGVTAKMISPQSIAVATAATGLVGKESDLFRFTVKHSLFFLVVICFMTYLQATVLSWMIPVYQKGAAAVAAAANAAQLQSDGFMLLGITAVIVAILGFSVMGRTEDKGAYSKR